MDRPGFLSIDVCVAALLRQYGQVEEQLKIFKVGG